PATPAAPVDVLRSAPRDATPGLATRPARHVRKPRPARHRVVTLNRVAVATVTRTVSVVRVRTVVRWHTRTAKHASPTQHPPLLPAPSAPAAPATFVPAVSEPHGNSAFTPLALSAGAIGALLLMFLAY